MGFCVSLLYWEQRKGMFSRVRMSYERRDRMTPAGNIKGLHAETMRQRTWVMLPNRQLWPLHLPPAVSNLFVLERQSSSRRWVVLEIPWNILDMSFEAGSPVLLPAANVKFKFEQDRQRWHVGELKGDPAGTHVSWASRFRDRIPLSGYAGGARDWRE
jgi:hypothetical protein